MYKLLQELGIRENEKESAAVTVQSLEQDLAEIPGSSGIREFLLKAMENISRKNPGIELPDGKSVPIHILDRFADQVKDEVKGCQGLQKRKEPEGMIYSNRAYPPMEIVNILAANEINAFDLPWYANPSLPRSEQEKGRKLVDPGVLLEELLSSESARSYLQGSIRSLDTANGCANQCDTCCMDAPLPKAFFDQEGLAQLFQTQQFLEMLHPASLRIGCSGDISDEKDPAKIIQMVLSATEPLSEACIKKYGKPHALKVFTNYRASKERKLDSILELALQNGRLDLCISLPLNKDFEKDMELFGEYVLRRKRYFGEGFTEYQGRTTKILDVGSPNYGRVPNINIHNVPFRRVIFQQGRIIEGGSFVIPTQAEDLGFLRIDRFAQRGLVKTHLNPDALWLQAYVTEHESHTRKSYTPITPQNIATFAQIPWNPFFDEDIEGTTTPPNWKVAMPYINEVKANIARLIAKQITPELRPLHTV